MDALRWFWCSVVRAGAVAAVVLAMLLTSASPLGASSPATGLSTLRLDYLAGVPALEGFFLDPAEFSGGPNAAIVALVHANLVRVLPNGTIKPDLAAGWTLSKNRLVYTFTIRRNARFSNGHDVTAHDVAFSLKRALGPSNSSSPAIGYLGLIRGAGAFQSGKSKDLSGVRVLGPRTVQITITQPAGYFLGELSVNTADILDPAVVAGKPIGALDATCIGNQGAGPFEFVCHDRSSTVQSFYSGSAPMYTLIPNPYYYGPKPHIRLELPAVADAYKGYLLGTMDTSPLDAAYVTGWQGKKDLLQFPSPQIRFLVPNTHVAPFNNVHCRLAVAYAINRRTIAAAILQGSVLPVNTIVPRGLLGHYPGQDVPNYSPKQARSQLAQCPGRTLRFALKFRMSIPLAVNEYRFIATELQVIGMDVRLMPLSDDAYRAAQSQPLDQAGPQLLQFAWNQDYPDPQDYLFFLLHSGVPTNFGDWRNAHYDRLVDRADALSSRKERAKLYIQAQHIALNQGAVMPLTQANGYELIKPYVHGLVATEAYGYLVPRDGEWASVWIGNH